MKKVLALVLAVVLCMGLATVAFAAAGDPSTDGSDKIVLTVKVEKTPVGESGDPAATYYKAEDLKASLKWNDGKEYFDKVEVEDSDTANSIDVTVKFKKYYGTDALDIDFELTMKKGSISKDIGSATVTGGYAAAVAVDDGKVNVTGAFGWADAAVAGDDDDTTVTVDFDAGQVVFDDDTVTFATFEFANAESLSVAGKMSKQDAINVGLDVAVTDEIKALMKKNEDVDFDVLNFVGKPEFDFTQEVTYYIEDEDVTYYVYEIKDGKAAKVNAKLNDDKDALVWKTRVLGCYIVTDAEIKAADVAEEGDKTETGDKENPETGATDFVGVAVALGAVSLVAAGAVALKK